LEPKEHEHATQIVEWVDSAWDATGLSERDEYIIAFRLEISLQEIGDSLDLTRERVRQLESSARTALVDTFEALFPEELAEFRKYLGDVAILTTELLRRALPSREPVRSQIVAQALGIGHPEIWGHRVRDLWLAPQRDIEEILASLYDAAPFHEDHLDGISEGLGLHQDFPIVAMLDAPGSPVRRYENHPWWVRKRSLKRDAAYLWLGSKGEPQEVSALADLLGLKLNAAREQCRRDDRMVQLRPSGLWSLREWKVSGSEGPRSAADAVRRILTEHGPMSADELKRQMRDAYPVTTWRVNQILSTNEFGVLPDGSVGLTEDGAIPTTETTPKAHHSVSASADGDVVGYRLTVDYDLLRGSGLGVPRDLAWKLGIRTIPGSRAFLEPLSGELVTVRRSSSAATVSSLRLHALAIGADTGCVLGVIFRLNDQSVRVVHGCKEDCPALSADTASD